MTGDEKAIRDLMDMVGDAIHRRDAREATAHYTADIVTFDLAPPLGSGAGEACNPAELQAWFDSWDGPIEQEAKDLAVDVDGALAFARGYLRMRGKRTGGEETDLWFRATFCFRKEDGEWRIAHEHMSVPFYMDGSDRAALDLKP